MWLDDAASDLSLCIRNELVALENLCSKIHAG